MGVILILARQNFSLYAQENAGIPLADKGVLTQIYTIPPASSSEFAHVSFLVAVANSSHQVQRILIGRTTLSTNPLTQPLINSLDNLSKSDLNGDGFLLDENGNVIYQTGGSALATYSGSRGDQPSFSNGTAPDGTRQLVYYQPVEGGPWAIVLTIPASQVQQLALNIALPMSVMIILVGCFGAHLIALWIACDHRFIAGFGFRSKSNRTRQTRSSIASRQAWMKSVNCEAPLNRCASVWRRASMNSIVCWL